MQLFHWIEQFIKFSVAPKYIVSNYLFSIFKYNKKTDIPKQ